MEKRLKMVKKIPVYSEDGSQNILIKTMNLMIDSLEQMDLRLLVVENALMDKAVLRDAESCRGCVFYKRNDFNIPNCKRSMQRLSEDLHRPGFCEGKSYE